ncbi:hypothetical protein SEA_NETYAP_136 [Mycobacterium phage Netyap]|nr:hypothetical protein SEA_NETYAP_136 [Mycobacterium phage Netyap]
MNLAAILARSLALGNRSRRMAGAGACPGRAPDPLWSRSPGRAPGWLTRSPKACAVRSPGRWR